MRESKNKSFLEVATNIAVLLAAMAVLAALSWGYFSARNPPTLHGGLKRGEVVVGGPQIDFARSQQTLLIAMSTKCNYCTEGIPFYNQLARKEREMSKPTRMVAIFPDGDETVNNYAQQNGMEVATIVGVDFEKLKVSATPTMILVDEKGEILDFWIGKLPEDVQQEVVNSISQQDR